MEKELIVGFIVAASLQVAIDRLASRSVLNFIGRRKLYDLRKLKEKLLKMVHNAQQKNSSKLEAKAWLDEVKVAMFDAENSSYVIIVNELFDCGLEAEPESQNEFPDQPSSSWELVEKRMQHTPQEGRDQ